MEVISYIAGTLTLFAFLPQTYKTIKTKSTKDLSLPTYLIISASAILWTTYGLYSHKPAIWATNLIVAVCSVIITSLKLSNK